MRRIFVAFLFLLLFVSSAAAGDLENVADSGALRFGVYPGIRPFIYYDENDDLTGIDIKLLEEIASRMGVDLEVYELSYESLIESLELEQTDVIGGAFSRTDARKQQIDFTKIYYTVGPVFVTLRENQLTVPLTDASFSGLKIGLKRGTAFEEWLRNNFVTDGIISNRDVYLFADSEGAIRALDKGRVDLVMMDADGYSNRYQNSGSYRSYSYGDAKDSYAFGVRKGSDLREEINKYLSEMLKDGTAQQIADSFFSSAEEEEPVIQWNKSGKTAAPTAAPTVSPTQAPLQFPTSTQVPTATWFPTALPATPTPAKCSYSMNYLGDITIPDGTQITAGSYFRKTWRFQNSGTCSWLPEFTFNFVSGSKMNGSNIFLGKTVYPGETVDISIDMFAPNTPGTYKGNWQLMTTAGYSVGPAVWVQISVPGTTYYSYPTATPDYSSAVQPSVKPVILWYYPNFYTQKAGQCVNLYWGLDVFSTAELFVDGVSVYFGSDDTNMYQICNEVQTAGVHQFKLCAYAAGGQTCETVIYTAN